MPINFGALGTGISQTYSKGYDESLDQYSTAAAGRGLQALQMLSQQQQGPPPGMGPPPMQPQGGPPPPMGGGGPPMQPPPMGGPPPMPQGAPPMGGPPGGPPPGMQPGMQPQGGGPQQPGGGLDWRMLIAAVQRGNPGAPPQVLMGAVNKLVPLMNSQSQLEWRHMQGSLGQQRVDATNYKTDVGAETAAGHDATRKEVATGQQATAKEIAAGHDTSREKTTGQNIESREKIAKERTDLAKEKEARITAHQKITEDQGWQRLDQQRKALEARIKQGGDRQAIAQWRAILDAQHKRTTEIIGSYGVVMDEKVRKRMLDESNQAYEKAIKEIGGGPTFGDRFQGGGQ